ncbi:3'(2'),5'-bisphosphate nucleotidase CysQ [Pullulanibacillus sp. KACC 23026]|uniref:3'(2'),5'-bisphosphate nucleotidase CysQ n=1 Tax=Pullulanibacillus sp. KACC 23026 TaxID=3028315 RepID=UPI0023B03111|nr:3'(2'),5'-bisphosphate nucleotidase CysQ [Pullulanibacillus sp. KACC 23026]WEG13515.1 3'(2'),5'-bisphosphate nucleotidase CysQ [Pullulanibacillus sp. KACC 23026]
MKRAVQVADLFDIALRAGQDIMAVYAKDFNVEYKGDDSPLTLADKKSHLVISEGLAKHYPELPILSEEGRAIPYEERKDWEQFWLVDPLDGTKEFIKKNDEFTVNIALIENGFPTLGVIYAPALDVFYFGIQGKGAFKLVEASKNEVSSDHELIAKSRPLPEVKNQDVLNVVASRSHMSEETQAFIDELKKENTVDVVSSGSSLKFCLVAEGKADYYPRYAPTMEWDTAAGQAIVEAAGGTVTRYEDQQRFYYNRENLLNGWFLAKR